MKPIIEIPGAYIMYSHTGEDIEKAMKDEERVSELLQKESILRAILEQFRIKITAYRDDWAEIKEYYLNHNQ